MSSYKPQNARKYVFQPSIQKQNPGSAPQPLETMDLSPSHGSSGPTIIYFSENFKFGFNTSKKNLLLIFNTIKEIKNTPLEYWPR